MSPSIPEDVEAWLAQGHSLEQSGQLEQACQAYEAAIALDDERTDAALALARIYVALAQRDEANSLLTWLLLAADIAPETRTEAEALLNTLDSDGLSAPHTEIRGEE